LICPGEFFFTVTTYAYMMLEVPSMHHNTMLAVALQYYCV